MENKLDHTWVTIKSDWFNQPSLNEAYFCIEETVDTWFFSVEVHSKPFVHPEVSEGYHEGLWEYDVAEWFIVNLQTGRYLEFNLSPTGAWWMMGFDAPRRRIDQQRLSVDSLKDITAQGEVSEKSWSARLNIPVILLETILGKGSLKHNVCFILGQDPELREYLSWTRLSSKEPDFHRPCDFLNTLK